MATLNVFIVSWCPSDRPSRVVFLRETLTSLFARLDEEPELSAAVHLVDNGSCPNAVEVIEEYRDRLATVLLWPENRGINAAYESLMGEVPAAEFTMMLDADMVILDRLSHYVQALTECQDIGAAGGQHSPEHESLDLIRVANRGWIMKRYERGSFMVFRTAELSEMRPFPISKKTDWDWHVCQWSARSIEKIGKRFAVLPGGARHLGWRGSESTWLGFNNVEWPGMYPDLPSGNRPDSTRLAKPRAKMPIREAYNHALNDAADIREHLPMLAALASGTDSAATLGHDVSTTLAFLHAGVPAVTNYHFDDRAEKAVSGISHDSAFACIVCDVRRRQIEPCDMLAIDSYHTFDQLRTELFLHGPNVRKTIVMHDTSLYGEVGEDGGPGMQKAIDEFLAANSEWTEIDRRTNNNGLTVLVRRRAISAENAA